MNVFRTLSISVATISALFVLFMYQADAAGPKVSEKSSTGGGNKHNLSAKVWPNAFAGAYDTGSLVDNVNKYQAEDISTKPTNVKGQQICIFCHTPHNAYVDGGAPLWNHKLSTQTFSRYSSTTDNFQIRKSATISAAAGYGAGWQPDGSSKLCLSCHDGVTKLGQLYNDDPAVTSIAMASTTGGGDVISSDTAYSWASFKPSGSAAFDKLRDGHHPVSFVYSAAIAADIQSARGAGSSFVFPSSGPVKVDKNGKMQCTTCHNPHQNKSDDDSCYKTTDNTLGTCNGTSFRRKVAPFWVDGTLGIAKDDRDAICLECHPINGLSNNPSYLPGPWSPTGP